MYTKLLCVHIHRKTLSVARTHQLNPLETDALMMIIASNLHSVETNTFVFNFIILHHEV
jgi:hypothetical protein